MDPLLISVEQAAQALGVGRDLVYELLASGRLPRVKIGRRTLIPARALSEWVERETLSAALDVAPAVLASKPSKADTEQRIPRPLHADGAQNSPRRADRAGVA